MAKDTKATPEYKHPSLVEVEPDLKLIADLLAGTRAMHKNRWTYIRKWADEDETVHRIRGQSETLFEGLSRTLSASVGMLFAKPPEIEWGSNETQLREHWNNIDGGATIGKVFVKRFADMAIRDGIAAILVDHPPVPNGVVVTSQSERDFNLRPMWAVYGRGNILSWRKARVNNQSVLTQVVLYEPGEVHDGPYATKTVDRYRVLYLDTLTPEGSDQVVIAAHWRLMEKVKGETGEDAFTEIAAGVFRNSAGQTRSTLPLALAHTGRSESIMESTIPLLGVAWANLSHYQISTNLRFYLDLAAFPQPTLRGDLQAAKGPTGGTPRLKVGPMVVVHLKGESDFKWTVPPSDSYDALHRERQEKKEQIADLGMSFLASDKRVAETAEAKRIDSTSENATLATSAQGIDDAVNVAFEIHSWYLGIEDPPKFELNRDFENVAMDAGTMVAYVQAVEKAGLPGIMLLRAWQKGGRIPEDQDLDEMYLEMMANQEALRDTTGEDPFGGAAE